MSFSRFTMEFLTAKHACRRYLKTTNLAKEFIGRVGRQYGIEDYETTTNEPDERAAFRFCLETIRTYIKLVVPLTCDVAHFEGCFSARTKELQLISTKHLMRYSATMYDFYEKLRHVLDEADRARAIKDFKLEVSVITQSMVNMRHKYLKIEKKREAERKKAQERREKGLDNTGIANRGSPLRKTWLAPDERAPKRKKKKLSPSRPAVQRPATGVQGLQGEKTLPLTLMNPRNPRLRRPSWRKKVRIHRASRRAESVMRNTVTLIVGSMRALADLL